MYREGNTHQCLTLGFNKSSYSLKNKKPGPIERTHCKTSSSLKKVQHAKSKPYISFVHTYHTHRVTYVVHIGNRITISFDEHGRILASILLSRELQGLPWRYYASASPRWVRDPLSGDFPHSFIMKTESSVCSYDRDSLDAGPVRKRKSRFS
jgi:hypothetical protein